MLEAHAIMLRAITESFGAAALSPAVREPPLHLLGKNTVLGHAEPEGAPRQVAEADLRRSEFSDGGICSNFPIHFFDACVPSRPTSGSA